MTAARHELANGDRVLRFVGEKIGSGTSRIGVDADKIRWTEVDIYRTTGGQYVVHKIGRSSVYHRKDTPCNIKHSRRTTPASLKRREPERYEDATYCPVCVPDDILLMDPDTLIYMETDRATAHVSTTAQGAVEAAHNRDPEGTAFLTRPAEYALRHAARTDPGLREAFLVEEVA